MFGRNVAVWDRWARLGLGIGSISLAFWGPQTPWAWLGLILVGTALLGHCPIYVMLGIRTCKPENREHGA